MTLSLLRASDAGLRTSEAARCAVVDALVSLFEREPDLAVIRWRQVDRGDLVEGLTLVFTDGGTFHAHAPQVTTRAVPPALYAVLADLLLFQTDLLFAAFGLGVAVEATRDALRSDPLTP